MKRLLTVALGSLLLTSCNREPDPKSPEAMLVELNRRHGCQDVADIFHVAATRAGTPGSDQARAYWTSLVSKLDLRQFEHAWFLVNAASDVERVPPCAEIEAALSRLAWPEIPSSWSGDEVVFAYDRVSWVSDTAPLPPGVTGARRRLALKLWPRMVQAPYLRKNVEAAKRTPLKALVEALTAGFDLRVRIVAEGTEEIPESLAPGRDVAGNRITAMEYAGIRSRVEASMEELVTAAFKKIAVGIVPVAGSKLEGAPATLEIHYEVLKGDKLYEAALFYAWSVQVKARVTLRVGTETWESQELTSSPDEDVRYGVGSGPFSGAILNSALENLNEQLLEALLKEK